MRYLILLGLITTVTGCGSSGSTEPTGSQSIIDVTVRDDIGVPVDRIPVIVTMSANRIDGRTGSNGKAGISVSSPGTYTIRVVPRDGYAGSLEPTVKSVSVETNATALVDFRLSRTGNSDTNPKEHSGGYTGW
jgi:hypothetical protein